MSMVQAGPWPGGELLAPLVDPTFCALPRREAYPGVTVGLVMTVKTLTLLARWRRFPVRRTRSGPLRDTLFHRLLAS